MLTYRFAIIDSMDDTPYQEIYFIGIALPEELSHTIAQLQWQAYKEKDDMLKPLVPHVTLLHPPSLKGIMPSELIPKVRQVAANYLPLTIELTEVGFFGKQVGYIRAESHKLVSLQSHLVDLLPPEARELHYRRPYSAHVTIAQKYRPKELDNIQIEQHVEASLRLPLRFEVESVSCFKRIKPREYAAQVIG